MIRIPRCEGKQIAVMGLGATGLTTARALVASGAHVLAWDDEPEIRRRAAEQDVPIVDLLSANWRKIGMLVLSPGIPHDLPKAHPVAAKAKAAKAEIVCDVELLARACPQATYVGVTGTNGKSTTTALIAHILRNAERRVEVGGNLGPAVLDFAPLGRDEIYVLEVSSYQLERTFSLRCDVAILLNISPNHLERHGDLPGYIAAKKRVFAADGKSQTAVIGVDDDPSRDIANEVAASGRFRTVRVTRGEPGVGMVGVTAGQLIDRSGGEKGAAVLNLAEAPDLQGGHNAQNAAAAYAAARALGASREQIAQALRSYRSLPHRLERIGTTGGVLFVNDSKATSPDATAWALSSYPRIFWIAGGLSKHVGYEALTPHIGAVVHAFLIGEAAKEIADYLRGHGIPHTISRTLDKAVAAAHRAAMADKGENRVVLLSPACASWDQFASFNERGDVFRTLVERLRAAR
jgi:UDP-N-acetylmuramoylalanine--D-glutamate ligase